MNCEYDFFGFDNEKSEQSVRAAPRAARKTSRFSNAEIRGKIVRAAPRAARFARRGV